MDEPTTPAPRCTVHNGAHPVYLGECHAFGAQVPRPFRASKLTHACPSCGVEVYHLTARGGSRFVLDAASGDAHACPPPRRVELDEERLANGLARAFDQVRDQRRQERVAATTSSVTAPPTDEPPPSYPNEARPQGQRPLGGIPRLTP